MSTSPEVYEDLLKQLRSFNLLDNNQINELIFKYINMKRPTDSVRMLNKDYRTIEYDNIEDNKNKIDKSNGHQFFKDIFHFQNCMIEGVKIFYITPCNKQTWVRFNKDLLKTGVIHNIKSDNPLNYVYYSYYLLKLYRVSLHTMIKAINYMYSEQCKNKKIRSHPNYNKGRQYFITAIEASLVMINEVLMMNGFVIKNPKLYLRDNPDSVKITRETVPTIINHYNHVLTLGSNSQNKKWIDSLSPEKFKENHKLYNHKMYSSILSIMSPCNFHTLCNILYRYSSCLLTNNYFHNIKNNIPNPEYIANIITIEIE